MLTCSVTNHDKKYYTMQNEKQKRQPYSPFERRSFFCIRAFPFGNTPPPPPLKPIFRKSIFSLLDLFYPLEPPCMHTPPKNLELEDGMYARFYCAASGDPVPTIYWQDKVQEPIPNVFEIKEVNISHVGIYKCTARSGKKSKDSYAFLSVNDHHGKYMLRVTFYARVILLLRFSLS